MSTLECIVEVRHRTAKKEYKDAFSLGYRRQLISKK
jgi:hypothetical protein